MPSVYTPDDPLSPDQIASYVAAAIPGAVVDGASRIGKGSTNLVYSITTTEYPLILKVAHRPDRIAAGILEKEVRMLRMLRGHVSAIPIPEVLYSGTYENGWPAFVMSGLRGAGLDRSCRIGAVELSGPSAARLPRRIR